MKQVVFSSVNGGQSHRDLILAQLFDVQCMARETGAKIDLEIMAFAFTDTGIAAAIEHVVEQHDNVQVRIIADWSQGAPNTPSVIPGLAEKWAGRIALKYKLDLPYYTDKSTGRVSWGYHTSHGMLHHKTLLVACDGQAVRLVLGSFNWSKRGANAYENTLLLERDKDTASVLDAFQAEFRALWTDKSMTLSPQAAKDMALEARKRVQAGASMHNLDDLQDLLADRQKDDPERRKPEMIEGAIVPAFAGRRLTSAEAHYGFSPRNNARKLDLLRPSGSRRPAPVTINSVALEAIRSVPDGAPIKVAMYAMSPRVAEFGALIEAARRGCPVSVLLDRKIGKDLCKALAERAMDERLPIDVRATSRRMHQKYILCPQSGTVVTGTANMTLDSANRHAEHRILFRDAPDLARQFDRDFDTIWQRLPAAGNVGR